PAIRGHAGLQAALCFTIKAVPAIARHAAPLGWEGAQVIAQPVQEVGKEAAPGAMMLAPRDEHAQLGTPGIDDPAPAKLHDRTELHVHRQLTGFVPGKERAAGHGVIAATVGRDTQYVTLEGTH